MRSCVTWKRAGEEPGARQQGPGRPCEEANAGKEEEEQEEGFRGGGICSPEPSRPAKFGWGLDFPSRRRHPNSYPVRKPKLSTATPSLAATASAPRARGLPVNSSVLVELLGRRSAPDPRSCSAAAPAQKPGQVLQS